MSRYINDQLRNLVVSRAKDLCEYCLIAIDDTYFGGEVDHVISVKHGEQSIAENLALACQACIRNKGSDLGSISQASQRLTRFFNPRKDKWSKHFRLKSDIIEPLTQIGEVTARVLGFNENSRVLERRGLIEINHYPPTTQRKRIK